jgi:hypothetical protein
MTQNTLPKSVAQAIEETLLSGFSQTKQKEWDTFSDGKKANIIAREASKHPLIIHQMVQKGIQKGAFDRPEPGITDVLKFQNGEMPTYPNMHLPVFALPLDTYGKLSYAFWDGSNAFNPTALLETYTNRNAYNIHLIKKVIKLELNRHKDQEKILNLVGGKKKRLIKVISPHLLWLKQHAPITEGQSERRGLRFGFQALARQLAGALGIDMPSQINKSQLDQLLKAYVQVMNQPVELLKKIRPRMDTDNEKYEQQINKAVTEVIHELESSTSFTESSKLEVHKLMKGFILQILEHPLLLDRPLISPQKSDLPPIDPDIILGDERARLKNRETGRPLAFQRNKINKKYYGPTGAFFSTGFNVPLFKKSSKKWHPIDTSMIQRFVLNKKQALAIEALNKDSEKNASNLLLFTPIQAFNASKQIVAMVKTISKQNNKNTLSAQGQLLGFSQVTLSQPLNQLSQIEELYQSYGLTPPKKIKNALNLANKEERHRLLSSQELKKLTGYQTPRMLIGPSDKTLWLSSPVDIRGKISRAISINPFLNAEDGYLLNAIRAIIKEKKEVKRYFKQFLNNEKVE